MTVAVINDAPALKQADAEIGMSGIGDDITVEASDTALKDDKVRHFLIYCHYLR